MSISNNELENKFSAIIGVEYVQVAGDGYHYQVTIVSDLFIGKSKLARQQWVYSELKDEIITGQLHALSMKTWTVNEWEKQDG